MTRRPRILLVLTTLLALPLLTLHAQTRIDPKNPGWQWFPVIDTMYGIRQGPGRGVQFGREIHPVGDVSGDGIMDFVVNYLRTDTSFTVGGSTPYQHYPSELLLFRGVKGGMPSDSSGERIGPSEIGADVKFLAAGDFDGDGWRDLVVSVQILGDTSLGNTGAEYDLYTQVVFWNDGAGDFTRNDTSHLQLEGVDRWLAARAVVHDWDNDGADDFLAASPITGYRSNQQFATIARLHVFVGRPGQRWGRNSIPNVPRLEWWNPSEFNTLGTPIDHDGDGSMDIPLILNMGGSPGSARVTMLYGRSGELPDTTDIETITLDGAGGRNASFSDVTGDGLPELLVDCGLQEIIKIYAGRRGQRLIEQFGSGDDDPQPGRGWWRRPWAELWNAHKLSDGWTGSSFAAPFAAYDGNLDGINDIWMISEPYLLCYITGNWLDSLIDGIIESPQGRTIGYLGDIDGSGAPVIAIQDESVKGIIFYKMTSNLPETGVYRKLPNETSGVEESTTDEESVASRLHLTVVPNPAGGEVHIGWDRGDHPGDAIISIRDVLGREVLQWSVAPPATATIWRSDRVVGGVYFITLTIGQRSATTRVVLHP